MLLYIFALDAVGVVIHTGLVGRCASSVMWRHCKKEHQSTVVDFRMSVTGYYKNDAMLRQISEAIRIEETEEDELINTKEE